jgi:hypothetical protein
MEYFRAKVLFGNRMGPSLYPTRPKINGVTDAIARWNPQLEDCKVCGYREEKPSFSRAARRAM